MDLDELQRLNDQEHLRLLSLFHKILAGILLVFGCCPSIHLFLGLMALSGNLGKSNGAPDPVMGWMFTFIGGAFIALYWGLAMANIWAGHRITERRCHLHLLILSGVNCLFMPIGTALAVFSFIVLLRPSVQMLFGVSPRGSANIPDARMEPPTTAERTQETPGESGDQV